MVELKSNAEIDAMAAAGAVVAPDRTDEYTHDSDGWTLRTASGARAAHSEHTVAVIADGPRILTN